VRLPVNGDRGLCIRCLDEAEDLAVLLVDLVVLIVDAEPALRVEVGLMCFGGLLGRHRSAEAVDVHEQWHCAFLSFAVVDGCRA